MKTFVRALALALPFLAVPAEAQAWGSNGGFQLTFNASSDKGGCKGAPWYTYWPYDAYFQVPAMSQYPYWPAPMVSPLQPPSPPAPAHMAPPPATHQPVGYYSVWPSYWYGH